MDVEHKRWGVSVLSNEWEKSRKTGLPLGFLSSTLFLYNFEAHTFSLKSRLSFVCWAASNNMSIWRNLGRSSAAHISSCHPLLLRNSRKGADGWVRDKPEFCGLVLSLSNGRCCQYGEFSICFSWSWKIWGPFWVIYFQASLLKSNSFFLFLAFQFFTESPVTRKYYCVFLM